MPASRYNKNRFIGDLPSPATIDAMPPKKKYKYMNALKGTISNKNIMVYMFIVYIYTRYFFFRGVVFFLLGIRSYVIEQF